MPTRQGDLPSGKTWMLIESRDKSVTAEQGEHLVLVVPRSSGNTQDCLKREELMRADRRELAAIADELGAQLSEELGNPGYYRVEQNGPKSATRDHLHFHIIAGKPGVTFRRCVDPIVV